MRKGSLFLSIGLVALVTLSFLVVAFRSAPKNSSYSVSDSPVFKDTIEIYKNGKLVDIAHNTLTDIGKDWIEDQMKNPQSVNKTKWITLSSNSGDCTSSAKHLANEITTSGLGKAECTITDVGTGSYSCEETFTATGTVSNVQVAGLHWNSTAQADDMLACGTFTAVNLEANDQLTVRWNVTIS